MIDTALRESPALRELALELIRADLKREVLRESVLAALESRFGSVSPDRVAALNTITDETQLKALHRLAVTCPDVEAFVAGLTSAP